jgi:hypothetical protein
MYVLDSTAKSKRSTGPFFDLIKDSIALNNTSDS